MTKNNKYMTQNNPRRPKMTKNDAKKQSVTDGRTDRRTDGQMDGRTDRPSYRDAFLTDDLKRNLKCCRRIGNYKQTHQVSRVCCIYQSK